MMHLRRTFRSLPWLLTGLVVCVLGTGAAARVQAKAEPSQPQHASQPAQPEQPGVGAQLAQETREAAGEEDHSGFKKSPSVYWLAKLMGGNVELAYWVAVGLNFAVVFGLVFWAGKKYLPGVFRNRTASIQRAMEEARRASEDANRRLADIEARLGRMDDEIKAMNTSAEREIAVEEARLRAATEEEGRKIVEAAEQEIAAAAKAARRDLTTYAADLAVTLAQRQIHVDTATDEALVRKFSSQISGEGSKN